MITDNTDPVAQGWLDHAEAKGRKPTLSEIVAGRARKAEPTPDLLSLLKRWAALDGGIWDVERHARSKAQLLIETRAAIAKAEGRS